MKRRYSIKVTSFDDLKAAFPLAVKERVIQKEDYVYISKLLDCRLDVPGVEVNSQLDLEEVINA